MQLSERAKLLIPQARIVSFTAWEKKYPQELIAIFQAADDDGRYLNDEDLVQITCLFPTLSVAVQQARLLQEKATELVANTRELVLVKFPQITEPKGELYPPERAEACWRDFWHFLRCITYGIAGQTPDFTSAKGLANMQLLYQELQVPLEPMIYGLKELKTICLKQLKIGEEYLLAAYFDHLIYCLQDFEAS